MGFGIGTAMGLVSGVFGGESALIRYLPKKIKINDEEVDISGLTLSNMIDTEEVFSKSVYKFLMGKVKSINPDVKKSESVRLRSDITEYALENGSVSVNHIIQNPIEVTLIFEETNAGKLVGNVVGAFSAAFSGEQRQSMYDKLLEIWEDKIQVEITTEQDIYKNMVISSMPITQKAPYKGAYQVMCSFKQITVSGRKGRRGKTSMLDKAASALVKGGLQVAQKVVGG